MRKHAILYIALLTAFACVREEAVDTGVKTIDCFTVTVEDSPMTKVHMEDGGAVKWNVGDCIGVYSDIQAPVPYYRGEDGKFTGEPVTGNTFYAFYPWNGFEFDESKPGFLKVINPISIIDRADALLPMVAVSQGNTLSFKQTSGILHLKIKTSKPFGSVTFTASVYDPDAGQIDLSESHPAMSSAPKSSICYVLGGVTEQGLDLYFSMPPMTIKGGFTVAVRNEEAVESITKSTSKDVLVERGKMISYTFDVDMEEIAIAELLDLEREALVVFYQAMDGDNWKNKTNWCSDKPLGEWYGVTTDSNGLVTQLSLIDNGLVGQIPEALGNITSLRKLDLSTYEPNASNTAYGGNTITGPLPESIGRLTKLEELFIQNEMISGTLPESMKNLKQLERLGVTGRKFFDGRPIDYSPLSGNLPEWLGGLTKLTSLNLAYNSFSGQVPASLGNLGNLVELYLDDNHLSGSLPDISRMSRLSTLDLQRNNFTGSIPAHYAQGLNDKETEAGIPWNTYRTEFLLNGNRLSGQLPVEITSHKNFPERVWQILYPQQKGYKIDIDNVPASRYVYESFDGSEFDLGAQYSNADYTMIVRWAEWCNPSKLFIPTAINLAKKYKELGLQSIWAYAGGEETDARRAFMEEMGLDQFSMHFIECYDPVTFHWGVGSKDHALWIDYWEGYFTPFVEIVNREGNIVFIDDPDGTFSQYPFSYSRSKLEVFLSNLLGGDEYLSKDFSADGTVHTLQTASKGAGVNVLLMGDAFSDRLIADGTYEKVMLKAVDALFSEEPYKSYKDHFNVSYVDVVSKNEVYYGETAFSTWYGNGTEVGGDDDKVFEYAKKVLTEDEIDDALIIVMMNRDYYAGTCYMYTIPDGDYGRGSSISYFPTSSDDATFKGLVSHEAGGHGFSKLADEYDYPGAITEEEVTSYKNMGTYGWWKNVDFTSDPTKVKWAKFIADNRYASENIGVYEGACTYQYGAWRPTEESIMRHNIGGFNAPSREAIYYRIHKLAYGDTWEYNFEDFVAWDLAHRTPAATSARGARPNFVEKEFEPLAPPVVVNKDWRELVRNGR